MTIGALNIHVQGIVNPCLRLFREETCLILSLFLTGISTEKGSDSVSYLANAWLTIGIQWIFVERINDSAFYCIFFSFL